MTDVVLGCEHPRPLPERSASWAAGDGPEGPPEPVLMSVDAVCRQAQRGRIATITGWPPAAVL